MLILIYKRFGVLDANLKKNFFLALSLLFLLNKKRFVSLADDHFLNQKMIDFKGEVSRNYF